MDDDDDDDDGSDDTLEKMGDDARTDSTASDMCNDAVLLVLT